MKTRKIICILIIVVFSLSACNAYEKEENSSHETVVINAGDATVNGYLLPDAASASAVSDYSNTAAYIGNKNSHIFHTADCSSAKNMKDTNKVFFENRNAAAESGYTPCKSCNP